MRRIAAIGCVALAGLLLSSSDLRADGFRISFGSGCRSGYYGGGSSWGGYPSYSRNFGYRARTTHRHWHDTSHWDYHPGTHYRHGNHYHYQPGHYDLHRTGHWDYHRHR